LPSYESAGDTLGEPVRQNKGNGNLSLVGLCVGRVNLSKIGGGLLPTFTY